VLGPPESLTTPSPYSGNLSITRDGRHLTYVQRIESSNIYKLSFDPIRARVTGAPIALTEGSRLFRSPSRSPDDKWIAFCSGGRQEDLFVVRVDGSGLRNLTDDPHRDRLPRWSPDGKDILFYSNRSGEFQVWTIRPDGSGLRQLTFERTGANEAAWSPDGSRIAYISHDAGAYVMDATRPWREQQRQKLSDMDEADCLFKPNSWSPDGQKLAGLCFAPTGDRGVYVYSLASGTYAKLAHPAGWATWLSDSRTLLFRQRSSLQLADSQTGKIREIFSGLTGGIWNVTVDVSADNRTIYYSAASIEGDVWLVSLQ
jgi:Tol biopolymer transport system component